LPGATSPATTVLLPLPFRPTAIARPTYAWAATSAPNFATSPCPGNAPPPARRSPETGHDKWRMSIEDGEAPAPEIRWRSDQEQEITLGRVPRAIVGRS
jgi:hypothetical protein